MQADPDVPPTQQQSLMRRFFGDGAVYAGTGLLGQGIAFLLFPFFAHVFSPAEFGVIDLLAVLTVVANLTITLEVSQGLARHFAESPSVAERREFASTALLFTLAIYSVFIAFGLLLAPDVASLLLGDAVDPSVVRVALCATWASGMLYLGQDLLRWQLRPRAYAAVSTTTAAVTALVAGVLILGFGVGVTGMFVAQLVGCLSAGLLAYWLGRDLFRLHFDRAKLKMMLAFSLPLVPASIGVFLNGYADRVAIQSQATLADVGVYGVAFRMAVVASLLLLGFQAALLPLILARYREPSTPPELERIFRLFCALALGALLLVSALADQIVHVLTPPEYYGAADIVPLVVAAAFFAGMYIFAPGPTIAKRTVPFALIAVFFGFANLGLALVLVGPLGITGAALAFLVTASGGFVALMVISQRLYPVPHRWGPLIACFVGIGVLTAIVSALPPTAAVLPVKLAIAAVGVAALVRWLVAQDERTQLWVVIREIQGTHLAALRR